MPSYVKTAFFSIGVKLLFFLGLLLLFLMPVVDTDFGWHFRCGQDVFQTGQNCGLNRYSYFLPDYRWGYNTFLYDASIYILYTGFGFWGVVFAGSFLLLASVYFLYQKYGEKSAFYLNLALFIFGSFSIIKLGYRAQMWTYFFYLILILVLLEIMRAKNNNQSLRQHLFLVFLFFVWCNTHPGFVFGLGAYFLFALVRFFKVGWKELMYPVLALVVTFLNVQGLAVFWETFRHYQVDLSKLIAEWTAPRPWERISILVLGLLVFFWSVNEIRKKRHLNWFLIFLYFGVSILTFSAKRHLPLYWLTTFFILSEFKLTEYVLERSKIPVPLLNQALIASFFFIGLLSFNEYGLSTNLEKAYCQQALMSLPCEAISHLSDKHTRLFTAYEWGGLLIWKKTNLKVFVDGRMPAWPTRSGKSPYTIYLEIIQARPGWDKTLRKHKTNQLLIGNGTFLDLKLQGNSESHWQEIYRDKIAVIYLPKN